MKTFKSALRKLFKSQSKTYPSASHMLTTKEKHTLILAMSVIIIPLIIGLGVYLFG